MFIMADVASVRFKILAEGGVNAEAVAVCSVAAPHL